MELAIVLLVLGILMRAAVQPLGARMEARQRNEMAAQLEQVKSAIVGYLILNGRLPCPGMDALRDDVPCTVIEGGISASLLGVPGKVDDNGLLLDAWGTQLRYRLASTLSWQARVSRNGAAGLPQPASSIFDSREKSLQICRTSAPGNCPRHELRVDQLEFVVLSHGRDQSLSRAQISNANGDSVFVQLPESKVDRHEFDDRLIWMSRSEMAYWLMRSGRQLF